MGTSSLLVLLVVIAAILLVSVLLLLFRRRADPKISIHSSIQHMRSIGHLSVFKVITKEIVTQMDHTWGDFGSKYLSWVISGKKMAMIFEFEIDFRYDLRRPEFQIQEKADGVFAIMMPPCFHEAHIRDIRFYDEQGSRFLPWLLPDLVAGFVGGRFTEADKNRLVEAAKHHAEEQAVRLIDSLQSEVQNSAKATLTSISKALGVNNIAFEFTSQDHPNVQVDMADELKNQS